jgi:hypothetical protein
LNPKILGLKANLRTKDQGIPATPGQIGTKRDDVKSLNTNYTFEGMPITPPDRELYDIDIDDEEIRC